MRVCSDNGPCSPNHRFSAGGGHFLKHTRVTGARRHLKRNRLLEPQHEFLDFAGTCLSEASFSRDDAKAALLEDAFARDVVAGDACVERARRITSQERGEGGGCDPVGPKNSGAVEFLGPTGSKIEPRFASVLTTRLSLRNRRFFAWIEFLGPTSAVVDAFANEIRPTAESSSTTISTIRSSAGSKRSGALVRPQGPESQPSAKAPSSTTSSAECGNVPPPSRRRRQPADGPSAVSTRACNASMQARGTRSKAFRTASNERPYAPSVVRSHGSSPPLSRRSSRS